MPPSIPLTGDDAATVEVETATPTYKNPFLWVPSSYLAMGLIYVTVGSVANIMFKNMGMENDKAAFFSSILGFPYTFKFVWAPLLELYKTKKFFVVLMQFAIAASVAGIAFALKLPGSSWFAPVVLLVAITAVLGATQDIGSDGVYVTTLTPKDQAKYLGFQSMCWNAGFLLAQGPFVTISGVLHEKSGSWATSWTIIMLAIGAIMFLAALWHGKVLPPGAQALEKRVSFSAAYLRSLLFSFSGRITRADFLVGLFILGVPAVALYLASVPRLLLLVTLPSAVALQVKRWHDRDKPGTMVLINLVPVLGQLWSLLELGFFPGKEGVNRYGELKPLPTFVETLETLLLKKGILRMAAFAFFYRFGYGLLDKMGPLFMIDSRANHGLGLSNQTFGYIYGTFGSGAFIVGSLIGGWIVSRAGLKKTLLILCLCLNVPNVTFLILSQMLPTNASLIAVIVTVEKLGWGIGAVGHMIYMMQQLAPGPYKTAHYTFATALMGACMMITGAVSGYVQKAVGYQWFFIIVLLAAAPSILATILAPFHNPDVTRQNPAEATA